MAAEVFRLAWEMYGGFGQLQRPAEGLDAVHWRKSTGQRQTGVYDVIDTTDPCGSVSSQQDGATDGFAAADLYVVGPSMTERVL